MSQNLNARQLISMEPEARKRLRAKAVDYDIGHGPFARVLLAAALDALENDADFRDRIYEDVHDEKLRYRKD